MGYFDLKAYALHPPVTQAQIKSAGSWLKVHFPADVAEFLQVHNGIDIGDNSIYGIPPSGQRVNMLDATHENRKAGRSEWKHEFLQISHGRLGNPFYIDLREAREDRFPVCMFSRADEKHCVVASEFPHFLWFFIEMCALRRNPDGTWKQPLPTEIPWPTNRDYVLRHDPSIEHWRGLGLPWEINPSAFSVE